MKNIRIIRLFIVVLIATGIGACTGDTLKAIDGPVVTEFPPNGSTNVQTSTGIYAIFAPNTNVDATTISVQTVSLLQDGQTTVPIQVNYTPDMLDGGTLEIIAGDLQAGSTYTVVLSNAILLGGNTLGQVLSGDAPAGGGTGVAPTRDRPGTVWSSRKYRDEVPFTGQQPQGLSVSLEDAEGGGVGVPQPDIISGSGEIAFSWSFATGGTPAPEPDEAPEEIPTCDDGVQNGDETGVDCGGSCPGCDGDSCAAGADCQSGVCGEDETCQAPACDDMVMNGDETGTDCGGSCDECPPELKPDGDPCADGAECQSGACEDGFCVAAEVDPCNNGEIDGDESDVDCGGGTCDPCGVGKSCISHDDCAGKCGNDNTCVACADDTDCSQGWNCVNNQCQAGTIKLKL